MWQVGDKVVFGNNEKGVICDIWWHVNPKVLTIQIKDGTKIKLEETNVRKAENVKSSSRRSNH